MDKPKIKVTWSILNSWHRGFKDQALRQLAGLQVPPNESMQVGLDCHTFIAENKVREFIFQGAKIPLLSENAIYEDRVRQVNYFKTSVNELLDLSGLIDAYDPVKKTIYDWKTGKRTSAQQNEMQIYIYAYLYWLCTDVDIDYGILAKVKKDKEVVILEDYSVYKINQSKLEIAHNFIVETGSEIYKVYEDHGFSFNFISA